MDLERVKGYGPWVLLKVESSAKMSEGGLYLPEGNLFDRIGYSVGRVMAVAKYYFDKTKSGKTIKVLHDVKKGDRVLFRGHLKEANKFEDGCFLHINDVIGVLEEGAQLDLCTPYDN